MTEFRQDGKGGYGFLFFGYRISVWWLHLIALLCLVAAYAFPFSMGGSQDAARQSFGLGAFAIVCLILGLDAMPAPRLIFMLLLMVPLVLARTAYIDSRIAGVAGVALFGLATCLGGTLFKYPRRLHTVLLALVIAAVINALEGCLQWLGLAGDWAPWIPFVEIRGIAYGSFRQRNLFASFLCVGIISTAWLLYANKISKAMAWTTSTVLALGIAVSASRTGMLELVAMALVAVLFRAKLGRTASRFLIGALGIWLVASILLPWVAALHGFSQDTTLGRMSSSLQDGRWLIWANALAMIAERPWTGWGWSETGFAHYSTLFEHRYEGVLEHSHNIVLQLLLEFGVLQVVIGIVCFGLYAWRGVRRTQCKDPQMVFAGLILLLIVGIHSMLEYPLWYADFLFICGIAVGYLLTAQSLSSARDSPSVKRVIEMILRAMAVSLIGLSLILWHQYSKLLTMYDAPFNDRAAQRAAVARASDVVLFRGYLETMELVLMPVNQDTASDVRQRAEHLLHFSAQPSVIRALIRSLVLLDDRPALEYHLERFCRAYPTHYRRWYQETGYMETRHLNLKLSLKCERTEAATSSRG